MTIKEQLQDLGYSIESAIVRDEYDGVKGSHTHNVTVTLNGKGMSCEFTAGCGHRHMPRRPLVAPKSPHFGRLTVHDLTENKKSIPNDPSLEDVLYSLLSDSTAGRCGESFGEFCENYGYDDDSRNAFKVYEACQDQYTKMCRLGVDFEALDAILEDF